MSDPFSHPPHPSKKKKKEEEKPILGERFSHWVEDGFQKRRKREARPMLRLAALMVIIACLAWGSQQPGSLKRALVGPEHPRTLLPIGIATGESPGWTEASVRSSIESVQPVARACLQGWGDMTMNQKGMVVAEVVLDASGPTEAAIYDQQAEIPSEIKGCLGAALGAVAWPLPDEEQFVQFPIVGMATE